ncbi:MAG: hypothetical protein ACXWP0_01390 [Ktedonobacterales bacterium]
MSNTRKPNSDTATPKKKVRVRVSREPLTPEEHAAAQETFLAAYAMYGNMKAACDKAHIHRSTAYRWLEHDEAFSLRHEQAKQDYCDSLRHEIVRRARDGVLKPVYQGKEQVGTVREYSDVLLIFEAKRHMPEYREKQQVEISGSLDVNSLAAEADAKFSAFLAASTATPILAKPDASAEG